MGKELYKAVFQLLVFPDDEMLFLNCNVPENFAKLMF